MSNCNRCGKYLPSFLDSICQECESIEREREEDREREEEREEQATRSREQSREDTAAAAARIEAAQAAAAHKIANPGEYDCPFCKYTALKYLASRCPRCQADTPSGYWTQIIEGERAEAEAARKAKVEYDRAAPVRKAAANLERLIDKKAEITNNKSFFFSLFNKQSKLDAVTGEIEKATSDLKEAEKSLVQIKFHDGIVTIMGHTGSVGSVAFSPDGKLLASNGGSKFMLWSVAERQYEYVGQLTPRGFFDGVASFSPDGMLLASSGANSVRLWSVIDRQEVATLTGHSELLLAVAFSPDGKLLASGGFEGSIKLWSVAERREVATLVGHGERVMSMAFSPDGKLLASGYGGCLVGRVKLWSVAERREVATIERRREVASVAFSPDGKLLASAGYEGIVKIWSISDQREVASLTGHSGYIESVAFSPDGKLLASGGMYNELKLWSVAKRRKVATLSESGKGSINSIAFSPDGKLLASGGFDQSVKLWKITVSTDL